MKRLRGEAEAYPEIPRFVGTGSTISYLRYEIAALPLVARNDTVKKFSGMSEYQVKNKSLITWLPDILHPDFLVY